MTSTYEEYAKIFKALCDENRLQILELLRDGEKCACILQDQLELGQSGLSYHMRILVESGIVESWHEGNWTHYRISDQGSTYAGEVLRKLTTINSVTNKSSCCEE